MAHTVLVADDEGVALVGRVAGPNQFAGDVRRALLHHSVEIPEHRGLALFGNLRARLRVVEVDRLSPGIHHRLGLSESRVMGDYPARFGEHF